MGEPLKSLNILVAPLAGAWIEINVKSADRSSSYPSPPSWGAWIEIPPMMFLHLTGEVAPLVGGVD